MSNRGGGKNRGRNWNHGSGGGRKFFDGSSNYSEHDDRMDRDRKMSDVKRRVSFKPFNGGRNKGVPRLSDIHVLAHLEDEAMGGDGSEGNRRNFSGGNGTTNPGKGNRRRGSPVPRGQPGGRRRLLCGPTSWFEIKIPYGHKYEKDFILRSLLTAIKPVLFIPHYWKVEDTAVSFYIDDFEAALALQKVDRTIGLPDGRKMIVVVRNGAPQFQVNEQLKERMKLAMVKRYNPTTKALNLEKFHNDPDLNDIFCALFRPQIMLAAFDVIKDNIPDLEALNVNNNKLHMLDHFKELAVKVPNLKILHMANNKIPFVTSLDSLKALPLVEINLDGNPLKSRVPDQSSYVSEVRKRLPKVIKLDDMTLPPPIGFDVTDEVAKLPTAKASFLCDMAGADIVRQFLEQYFIIFDSDNRQPLLEAYHEHAMVSMTAYSCSSQRSQQRLISYMPHNRNINAKSDLESRCRYLKLGRLPVVTFLSELPSTKHDPQSFVVDLTLFTPRLIQLTVTGVFKERKLAVTNEPMRSFQRTLVIVPSGGGFCIRNEMIHINNTTWLQKEKAFKDPASNIGYQASSTATASAAPVPAGIPPAAVTVPAVHVGGPDDNTKLQMVQAMVAHSNMNVVWSRKCLEETNWNFERAGFAFAELRKQNRIPPEAFVKN
ncbi:nuclear RNA export factor 1 [Toxorhynchites rutilus septentrionalis]|uniref:nuclear RNA export factor 1 n=1 Tax=Toxorhynchites rutilus septentrionalis TaxID=329112 RepID=UPI00247AC6A3|nr:nuclear RNA export factor 1 [Toxorhynchites rutilus septentrionalis]